MLVTKRPGCGQHSLVTRPRPLPEALRTRPFTVREARLLRVGERRLRAQDLERPFHGVRTIADSHGEDGLDRRGRQILACRNFAPLLRDGDRFSHVSALALHDLPLPLAHEHDDVLHVARPSGAGVIRRSGIITHRVIGDPEIRHRAGLPVSAPADLFLQLAALVPLDDLVAVGDALVLEKRMPGGNRQRPIVRLPHLREAAEAAKGRGSRVAREAVELVRPGVESPMESRLRLLVIRAGLPEPVAGAVVRDSGGRLLGYADLLWPERRLVLEYDGDQHRSDRRQFERDIHRIEEFGEAGFEVIRVRRDGLLLDPIATTERVVRAFHRAEVAPESTRTAARPSS